MGWKTWPSWVKGGIITIIIVIILYLILLPFSGPCSIGTFDCSGGLNYSSLIGIPAILFILFLEEISLFIDNDMLIVIEVFVFSGIFYFFIGAIIGWVVGKIRKRN